jgi:hypothetical protein
MARATAPILDYATHTQRLLRVSLRVKGGGPALSKASALTSQHLTNRN